LDTSRRTFLKTGSAAALGLGLAGTTPLEAEGAPLAEPRAGETDPGRAQEPLRMLILGGTGFIGPHMVRYAHARGHRISIFTRGNRHPDLPDGVEWLVGDRNDDLTALEGREWDVVMDNHTTFPKWIRDTGSLLQDAADRYFMISTISVYADQTEAWADETDGLAEYTGEDPYAEEGVTGQNYGPLKALSERETETWFPGRATIVRPGLIVGPGDPTDRWTYWPVRVQAGGDVLAPPRPDPVQFIDARDLTHWVVRLAEERVTGVFNATGPESPMDVGGMLDGIRAVTGGAVRIHHADADFLAEHEVRPWGDMPVWIPDTPETAGFSRRSIARAIEAGLTFRPTAETVADTLAWNATRPGDEGRLPLRAGLAPERETELLAAWEARSG
jgi:2'-hydroxyisoflavone reductase